MTNEDDSITLEELIQRSKGISRDTIERAAKASGEPGVVSSNMNLNYSKLNSSLDQYEDEPRYLLFEHSPGFSSGETGMVKVKGKSPRDETGRYQPGQFRRDNEVNTDYVKLEVLPEEAMPRRAKFSGQNIPEGILEHDELTMRAGETVFMQIHPWDDGQVYGSDWQENLLNYERGDLEMRN